MDLRAPKGVFDIYPGAKELWQDSSVWQTIESLLRTHAQSFNFKEIRTPIFEHLELFHKGVGDSSDIVSKEMYTFLDKGGRELALRPEGTAAVIRAFIENKMYALEKTQKLFYIAPMFRYERQQAGRYRQHHQFGAEAIGIASPYQDAEIIDMALSLYKKVGIKNPKLLINCVGGFESRGRYTEALKHFLEPKFEELSEDSKMRFHKNMLRILDSKDPKDQMLLEGCPNILEFLDVEKRAHFETVLEALTDLGISYELTPKLVRGLDYYDSTVFEVVMPFEKSILTIGGGGRYDGLIQSYGASPTPSVGFGTGLERIIQTLIAQNIELNHKPKLDAYIIPLDKSAEAKAFHLAHQIRSSDLKCDIELSSRKLKAALPFAATCGAKYAIIIGSDELSSNRFKIKNLSSRQEIELEMENIISFLKNSNSS